MTIQANDKIYPLYQCDAPEQWTVSNGMTLREHFAIMAMQGLVSHYGYGEAPAADSEEIAEWAVKLADSLIQALNRH